MPATEKQQWDYLTPRGAVEGYRLQYDILKFYSAMEDANREIRLLSLKDDAIGPLMRR